MIRIHRVAAAPEVLRTNGVERSRAHAAEVEAAVASSQPIKLTFDQAIYGDASVKRELIAMQHGKCAFCEAKPLHVSDGDVEHFRPKGAVRQADSEPLQRPGYYWLAYDWNNLLLACGRCNQRHKKNLFPLLDPSRRARSPGDPIHGEAPIFIDPAAEDPAQFITYREHVPVAIDSNPRGEHTIDALGLRRAELSADREDHLARIMALAEVASNPAVPEKLRSKASTLVASATSPSAEYSLMCRVALTAP